MADLPLVPVLPAGPTVPVLFAAAGEPATRRLIEFFTAEIRNPNTRAAYARAVVRFDAWCQQHHLTLAALTPVLMAAYVEQLGRELAKPSVKQHLAALRMLGNYLVVGGVLPSNPTAAVRGPKHVVKKGRTPVLAAAEARELFAAIDVTTLIGLRDRALIGVMCYSFARVGAVLAMDVDDYYQQGKRGWLHLHEKGGKEHHVPAHHVAEEYLDAYLAAAGLAGEKGTPLFRTFDRRRRLTPTRLTRQEAWDMVKRRARAVQLGDRVCNHSFRATGITVFLDNGGTLEKAQQIAAHESPETTKLYDRTSDQLTLDEIERIRL